MRIFHHSYNQISLGFNLLVTENESEKVKILNATMDEFSNDKG